jgi:16S rRNA (adenine1518-N6/adenine1519-N6)-dimethyltransferase
VNKRRPPQPAGLVFEGSARAGSLADETRAVLRTFHVHPKEQLGQHFLIDREALDSVVRTANLSPGRQVLEIGPGIGTLTLALAATGAEVEAVELDAAMARIAAGRTAGLPNVHIQEGNILHANLADLLDLRRPYTVVANIPYYITGPILRRFLEADTPPESLVLMVQREVGERLAATPGRMSMLAVFAQIYTRVQVMRIVPATSFLPPPAVASAVIRLQRLEMPAIPPDDLPFFFRVVRAGFGSKRKMIHNALNHALPNSGAVIDAALADAGVERERRAETLSIAEWRALAESLRADPLHTPRPLRPAAGVPVGGTGV